MPLKAFEIVMNFAGHNRYKKAGKLFLNLGHIMNLKVFFALDLVKCTKLFCP